MDSAFRFDLDGMLRNLREFDPMYYKYGEKYWSSSHGDMVAISDLKEKVWKFEETYCKRATRVTHGDEIFEDLQLIYGSNEPIVEYIELYKLTSHKIIDQYLGIEGLDKLYTTQYFRHEWEMHLAIKFEETRYSCYRDHFIHQIKDAYECFVFATKFGFMEKIRQSVSKKTSIAGSYVVDCAYKAYGELQEKALLSGLYRELFCESKMELSENKETLVAFFEERIVLSSLIIAGLFHDIGYPIEYAMEGNHSMEGYLPVITYFINNDDDYAHVSNLLCNSLLFTVVPRDEIRKQYSNKDHGTLSALALLVYFYENGSIYHLDEIQKASIELAALTIYNHTLTYELTDKGEYNRPVFSRNPISYLFRICDDIQEWDRLYLFLSKNKNLRVCRKCHTPSLPWKRDSMIRTEDVCACVGTRPDSPYFENLSGEMTISSIQYRKLNHVKICDYVDVKEIHNEDAYFLDISIHYSPYRLLQMADIDPAFFKFRAKDLNKLRRHLDNQSMPRILISSAVTTNPIYLKVQIIDEFLQAVCRIDSNMLESIKDDFNHYLLCSRYNKALMEFLSCSTPPYTDLEKIRYVNFIPIFDAIKRIVNTPSSRSCINSCFRVGALHQLATEVYDNVNSRENQVGQRVISRLNIYLSLLIMEKLMHRNIENEHFDAHISNATIVKKISKDIETYSKDLENVDLISHFRDNNKNSDCLEWLIRDCLTQMLKCRDYKRYAIRDESLPSEYYEQFRDENTDKLLHKIAEYVATNTYHPFRKEDDLDFYFDLYFFNVLSGITEELERLYRANQSKDSTHSL